MTKSSFLLISLLAAGALVLFASASNRREEKTAPPVLTVNAQRIEAPMKLPDEPSPSPRKAPDRSSQTGTAVISGSFMTLFGLDGYQTSKPYYTEGDLNNIIHIEEPFSELADMYPDFFTADETANLFFDVSDPDDVRMLPYFIGLSLIDPILTDDGKTALAGRLYIVSFDSWWPDQPRGNNGRLDDNTVIFPAKSLVLGSEDGSYCYYINEEISITLDNFTYHLYPINQADVFFPTWEYTDSESIYINMAVGANIGEVRYCLFDRSCSPDGIGYWDAMSNPEKYGSNEHFKVCSFFPDEEGDYTILMPLAKKFNEGLLWMELWIIDREGSLISSNHKCISMVADRSSWEWKPAGEGCISGDIFDNVAQCVLKSVETCADHPGFYRVANPFSHIGQTNAFGTLTPTADTSYLYIDARDKDRVLLLPSFTGLMTEAGYMPVVMGRTYYDYLYNYDYTYADYFGHMEGNQIVFPYSSMMIHLRTDGSAYNEDYTYTPWGDISIDIPDAGIDSLQTALLDEFALLYDPDGSLLGWNEYSRPGVGSINGDVVKIDLRGKGISGPFPWMLASLPALDYLDIADNNLCGDISEAMIPAERISAPIRRLFISGNRLEGNAGILPVMLPTLTLVNGEHNRFRDLYPMLPASLSANGGTSFRYQDIPGSFDIRFDQLPDFSGAPTILLSQIDYGYDKLAPYLNASFVPSGYPDSDIWIWGDGSYLDLSTAYYGYVAHDGAEGVLTGWGDMTNGSQTAARLFFREGDSNFDSFVNVMDIQNMVNYIRDYHPCFNFSGADIYPDGVMNVQDIVRVINMILDSEPETPYPEEEYFRSATLSAPEVDEEAILSIVGNKLLLSSSCEVAAFDISLSLPGAEWADLPGMTSSGNYGDSRRVAYSLSGASIPAGVTVIADHIPADTNVEHILLCNPTAERIPARINVETSVDSTEVPYPVVTADAHAITVTSPAALASVAISAIAADGRVVASASMPALEPGVPFILHGAFSGITLFRLESSGMIINKKLIIR